uniref:Staphylococcal nuclease domain-containing protein 1 n=1 Tax=Riptortus pedestris TaxID=329032 RepID=R4WE27_RIPPE|nr:ebna2 binding protein P100 [Riptortus pedestris]
MSAPQPPQPETPVTLNRGVVKQVLSGDTVVIRGVPKGGPPPEKTFSMSSLVAPKLAKRPQAPGSNPDEDEPYAWEAREFLRRKVIGQTVLFTVPKERAANQNRDYGTLFIDHPNGVRENINELMVKEGLVTVRTVAGSKDPVLQQLTELQDQAKAAKKGKWSDEASTHVRQIKWAVEGDKMLNFVDKTEGKPINAIIEHVRDGSTVRAFLLPDFTYITLMMSGIRCPANKLDSDGRPDTSVKVEFADEAKYFTEARLLQQDVEIVLESVNNNNFVGTVLHPKGNIAEELLKNGYAHCVDWSIAMMKKADADKLRQAEKLAKEKRLRIWKDWTPPPQISDKEFTGTVVEVVNGDALMVKLPNGTVKKIFLASIRPPREQNVSTEERTPAPPRAGRARPLYDIPWMFEAREYLRKKLIGKKVNVTVDYIQPARDSLPEKTCCTVAISSVNIAEALVSKGLATVVRYRQNDDQRASAYDALLAAENKAAKSMRGVHAKKDIPIHRVNDITADPAKAKNLLPHIMRNSRIEALVEFVVNGSRMRLYVPKDSHLITFLLSGIEVRCDKNAAVNTEEAALQFTRDKCMQREVEIQVEGTDRNGNFIGWLWVDNVNLSVALVEAGLARIHATGENSRYAKDLLNAKNIAKAKGLWKYEEKEEKTETIEEDKAVDRKTDYKEVYVVEVSEIGFYCQIAASGSKLNALQAKMAQEMAANPPLPGAYSPKKGDLCAAKYPADNMWYRAKVEKVTGGGKVSVFYIDYGNRADIQSTQCAPLPPGLDINTDKPYANHYTLAFVSLPKELEDIKAAEFEFKESVVDRTLLLNVEYDISGVRHATLLVPETEKDKEKLDIGKSLVADGFLLVSKRREKRFEKIMIDYMAAQEEAKKKHLGIWQYGDIREDDDKEFGMGR